MNTSGDVVRMIRKRVHEFCDLYDLQYVNILYSYVSSGVYTHVSIYIVISRYTYLFLVRGLEHFLFFHILGIVIRFDFHIFQRGRSTTNQLYIDI